MKLVLKRTLLILAICLSLYGLGRLYLQRTDGFFVSHILSTRTDFPAKPIWSISPLSKEEKQLVQEALHQPYTYLGKGCQSYVFASQDGKFVLKFFKYQRFRPQAWLRYLPPLPALTLYMQEKAEKRERKLLSFMKSWQIAYNELKQESGLLCMHLNKTNEGWGYVTLIDRAGTRHQVDLDQTEFYLQKRGTPLEEHLLHLIQNGETERAKKLIDALLQQILSAYQRGLGDRDHALLQNTGVLPNDQIIHIDIGQFTKDPAFTQPLCQNQELFSKTYRFAAFLQQHSPLLAAHLQERLVEKIGSAYFAMEPIFRPHGYPLDQPYPPEQTIFQE